jgi:hypothetical protein
VFLKGSSQAGGSQFTTSLAHARVSRSSRRVCQEIGRTTSSLVNNLGILTYSKCLNLLVDFTTILEPPRSTPFDFLTNEISIEHRQD